MRTRFIGIHLIAAAFLLAPPCLSQRDQKPQEVTLIKGLDGGKYEPYKPSAIRNVQQHLKDRGYYTGEVNGVLDEDTMRAIAGFQDDNGIAVNGIPTPATRQLMEL